MLERLATQITKENQRALSFFGDTGVIAIQEETALKTDVVYVTAEELAQILLSCAGGFVDRFNAEIARQQEASADMSADPFNPTNLPPGTL